MRLIDADALKKCAIPCQIHNGALTDLCVPLYQINNAPTVERPQGDLISREALKEALTDAHINMGLTFDIATFNCVMNTIDNAPTIKDRSLEITQKSIELGREVGQLEGKLERPQGEPVIKCQDCKHQTKDWHEDKRMKEGGYWVYDCDFICDPFESTPVCGQPEEYCSSAEQKGEIK